MDRRTVIAFILMGIVIFVWFYWMNETQKRQAENLRKMRDTTKTQIIDSLVKEPSKTRDTARISIKQTPDSLKTDSLYITYGSNFYKNTIQYNLQQGGSENVIIVETEHAYMEFSNFGAGIRKYIPKDFKKWDGDTLQLIDWKAQHELSLLFTSKEGKTINTKNLAFNSNYTNFQHINLSKEKDFVLTYELFVAGDSSKKIIIKYKFNNDRYDFNADFEFINPGNFISSSEYQIVWGSSLNLSEYFSTDEDAFSEAYAYMGGKIATFKAGKFQNEYVESDKDNYFSQSGKTEYVCSRNKYFGVFLIPSDKRPGDGAYLTGYKEHLPEEGIRNHYKIALKMELKNPALETASVKVLVTPIDYKILKSYDKDLQKTMTFTLDFLVRPIAQYVIIPFFTFLHGIIPNYGLVIIVFAIVMKIVLNPLMKKQMESARRMSALNPKMTEIREKYKDDPNKMNKAIMNLYKEEGINPMSGCLPLLLQLPILFALFGVFRSTIELRQAHFFWWIKDLSMPDTIISLPFKLPLLGTHIPGLAILMGITMFLQQKMTITDPKQKSMVYMMPILFTIMFFSLPSGLNLYYFVFNLLSIAQQYYLTKIRPPKEDEIKKKPRKPTFMERLQKRSEEIRKANLKRR